MVRIRQRLGAAFRCLHYSPKSLIAFALLGACSASALAASKMSIRLEGDITPECTIDGRSGSSAVLGLPLELGDITRPGRKDYAFLLNCNAPFGYRLEAQYGALTNTGVEKAPDGFAAAVPYDVTVRIPTDGAPIQDWCSSESIRSGRVTCPFSNSGNAIALRSQAELSLTWRSPGKTLMAGQYVDWLTIRVTTTL
jgi:hypothetical protein